MGVETEKPMQELMSRLKDWNDEIKNNSDDLMDMVTAMHLKMLQLNTRMIKWKPRKEGGTVTILDFDDMGKRDTKEPGQELIDFWEEAIAPHVKEDRIYAGFPVPVNDRPVTMAWSGNNLYASPRLTKLWQKVVEVTDLLKRNKEEKEWVIRNQWYSTRLGGRVGILENTKTHKLEFRFHPNVDDRLLLLTSTISCSAEAWSMNSEIKAMEKLRTHITPTAFKRYFMTGCFIESSRRSHLNYMFRRGRPTLAVRMGEDAIVLAALCMHPVAYYERTWAGSLVPTDEVIAHLLSMRADEHLFWRKCNQHNPEHPEAGI